MIAISLEHYTQKQRRDVQRVLDALDRRDSRMEQHFNRLRRHERRTIRAIVSVRIFTDEDEPLRFRAWARDLSQGGLAFVHPMQHPLCDAELGLHLPGGDIRWFDAEIVRSRPVGEDGFWEYGVRFRAALSR